MEDSMKVLKIFGLILLVLVVLIIVLGLIAPKKYEVERSVIINAPNEMVFNHVVKFRNWNAWSPWAERDSTMTYTVEGKDGEEGAVYKWVGDAKITGTGEITNTGVKPNEEMVYHLHFILPFEDQSDGYTRVADVEGGTKVSWGMYGKNAFPMNIMFLFMSMEKMMGPDFERGLELLKGICEKEAAAVASYEIKEVNFRAKRYAAIQQEVAFADMKDFFGKSFAALSQALEQTNAKMMGAPSALYFTWDEGLAISDMAAAFATNRTVSGDNIKMIKLEGGKVLSIDYYGPYEGLGTAHMALGLHMKKNNLEFQMPAIEEYITDPGTEPDSSKWLTKVYYLVK
jgi:effector-binding domain-containing protein